MLIVEVLVLACTTEDCKLLILGHLENWTALLTQAGDTAGGALRWIGTNFKNYRGVYLVSVSLQTPLNSSHHQFMNAEFKPNANTVHALNYFQNSTLYRLFGLARDQTERECIARRRLCSGQSGADVMRVGVTRYCS